MQYEVKENDGIVEVYPIGTIDDSYIDFYREMRSLVSRSGSSSLRIYMSKANNIDRQGVSRLVDSIDRLWDENDIKVKIILHQRSPVFPDMYSNFDLARVTEIVR